MHLVNQPKVNTLQDNILLSTYPVNQPKVNTLQGSILHSTLLASQFKANILWGNIHLSIHQVSNHLPITHRKMYLKQHLRQVETHRNSNHLRIKWQISNSNGVLKNNSTFLWEDVMLVTQFIHVKI